MALTIAEVTFLENVLQAALQQYSPFMASAAGADIPAFIPIFMQLLNEQGYELTLTRKVLP